MIEESKKTATQDFKDAMNDNYSKPILDYKPEPEQEPEPEPEAKKKVSVLPSILRFKDKKSKDFIYEMLSDPKTPFNKLNQCFVMDYDRCNPITKPKAIDDFNKLIHFKTYKSKLHVFSKNIVLDGLMSSVLNKQGIGNNYQYMGLGLNKFRKNDNDIENQENSRKTVDFSELNIRSKDEFLSHFETSGKFYSL
jgi:hypothetical protein